MQPSVGSHQFAKLVRAASHGIGAIGSSSRFSRWWLGENRREYRLLMYWHVAYLLHDEAPDVPFEGSVLFVPDSWYVSGRRRSLFHIIFDAAVQMSGSSEYFG